ncbi:MAG: 23S rRNA (guanosine(2251)-2'-O)-methyltransferase RlmB [Nitrospirae bacterium]|nr:23S rRNA (guanosine(2251)-2'-O)-methyltransferase RlmB [Nitrospirota bacterium]
MKTKKLGQTGGSGLEYDFIYGLNPVLEALKAGRNIKEIFLSTSRTVSPEIIKIEKEAGNKNISIKWIGKDFYSRFPKGHQGVAAKVLPKTYIELDELLQIPSKKKEMPFFIVLDCIEDPRNFGAIIRVADAAGAHGIVIQSYRSVNLSSEVSKTSAGAVEYVPISKVVNIKHAIEEMKKREITIIGAEVGWGKLIWDVDLSGPIAIVIGSEGKGLRKTVRENCDIITNLPMKGRINSLNISVATGIFAFEILRKRCKNI